MAEFKFNPHWSGIWLMIMLWNVSCDSRDWLLVLEGWFLLDKDYPLNYQRTYYRPPLGPEKPPSFSWGISSQYLWLKCSPRSFQIGNMYSGQEREKYYFSDFREESSLWKQHLFIITRDIAESQHACWKWNIGDKR